VSLVWEEPPPDAGNSGRWGAEADELRRNTGKWARIAELGTPKMAYNLAHQIKTGALKSFKPAGAFDARTKATCVWVRHVGEEQP
jgi:hypothetical protein